jgi:hypothetical protein
VSDAWPILAVVAPAVTGWLAVGAVAGEQLGTVWARVLRFLAGIGIGFAIASGAYFLWRVAGLEHGMVYRLVDCLVLPCIAAIACLARRHRQIRLPPRPGGYSPSTIALVIVSVLVASLAIIASARLAIAEPSGNWDANAIWNLKAKFFYRGAGDAWSRMFDREIWFSHPDYPLMLPAAVARLWSYLGHETHLAPIAVGVGFTALTLGVLFTGLACVHGLRAAGVGLLLLAGNEVFLWYGGAQVADVPLGFFVLVALVYLTMGWKRATEGGGTPSPRLIALAGACVGLGAFVKNEGLAICVALAIACAVASVLSRQWKPLIAVAAGMVIGLAFVAIQKTLFTGETYLTADQPSAGAMIEKVVDPERHRTILAFLARWYFGLREGYSPAEGWRLNQWPVAMVNEPAFLLLLALPILLGVRVPANRRPPALAVGLALLLVILTYYAVLLVMPYDLSVLVQSLPRYFLHVVPGAIFWVCYVTRWEAKDDAEAPGDATTQPTTAT